jgi:outer membrane translocation and assembly module TamA
VFVHTIHAAAFVDVGQVWTSRFNMRDMKTSVGIELSANVIAGYKIPVAAALGVSRGHDGSGAVPDAWTTYIRIGRAF